MLTVYEIHEKTGRNWWRDVEDLTADLETLGYEILESNMEWVSFYDPRESDDLQYHLTLWGMTHIAIDHLDTYARVSTDTEEQQNSFDAQVAHYTGYIQNNPEWEFAGVYADEAQSGTSTKNRDGFNQMVQDALDGKFDLIITKAISRFARNTVDTLTTIRKLIEHNIEVYFEKEGIYTLDGKGELLITIMSSIAQEEARNISENVKRGHRWRFENGKVYLPYGRFLGYERGEDGLPQIVESQAEVVRQIYRMYLDGNTLNSIARYLTGAGIPTPGGKTVWAAGTINGILTNEKYKGEALLQKGYTVDFLTKERKRNNGEVQQFYVKNSHPAIIPPDIFDIVQAEMKKRKSNGLRQSGLSHFSSKLICGSCGSFYGPKVWHSNSRYRQTVWQCNSKHKKGAGCNAPHIKETTLEAVFIEAVNKVFTDRDILIAEYGAIIDGLITHAAAIQAEHKSLTDECEVITEMIRRCVEENAVAALNQDEYRERYSALAARYEKTAQRRDELAGALYDSMAHRESISRFLTEVLGRDGGIMTRFDVELWCAAVENATIEMGGVRVHFKNGTAVAVSIG
jgi:DNA invertase Pin-like site-specific DNA recombinase